MMRSPAAALAALALVASACDADDDKPTVSKHAAADVEARADQVYGTFRTMFDNLPEPSAAAMKCPDEKVSEWTAEGRERQITFLSYQSLRHTLGEPWLGNSLVGFITNANVRYASRDKFDLTKERNIKHVMRIWDFVHYVGVVVPIAERGAQASSAYGGDGGLFSGQLVVYRKGQAQPICHTPFSATGSGTAEYLHDIGDSSNEKKNKAQFALKKALCEEIRTEIKTQVGQISSALSPSSIDCNGA